MGKAKEMSSVSLQNQQGYTPLLVARPQLTPAELLNGFVDLVFPPVCLACGNVEAVLCGECRTTIEPLFGDEGLPDQLDGIFCRGRHSRALRKGVVRLKYGGKTCLARPLAELCAEEARPAVARWGVEALLPVPIHWTRQFARGFNQSELLAKHLGQQLGLPVTHCVRRTRATGRQVGLTGAARRTNLRGAFALSPGAEVAGRRVALVDDVCTTGTTLTECATVLRAAGAAAVFAITVRRG